MKHLAWISIAAILLAGTPAPAEVVSSSSGHFELRHEAVSTLAPDALWARLVQPATWWHPDHTYSGDAANLSLDPVAGGLWLEKWADGSVAHGEVVNVVEGRMLRLNAPFGPLQGAGAYTIWTITISPEGDGSHVVFDEIATGPPTADMAELAGAVDYVKGQAIERLAAAR
jgi:uncharacterized protein YndB with AHSA1/START domain